jgi:tRNA/rRNA methyltransferase
MPISLIERCRVVLVRPQKAGNIGSTARVMRNMGLSDLVLVAPEADIRDREARRLSTQGESILDQARIVSSIEEALADCIMVAGTSARTGGLFRRQSAASLADLMPRVVEALSHGRVALVFGPERTGLTNDEVSRCHYLVHIPTDAEYPALNLAQAVAITLYELRCRLLSFGREPRATANRTDPATHAHVEHMFAQLKQSLEAIHFLYGPKSGSLMHALRHLIARAMPDEMEVDVLRGLARQIGWAAAQIRSPLPPSRQERGRGDEGAIPS